MKIREDYENVAWRRFVRWVNGDEQPQRAEKQNRTHREKTGYKGNRVINTIHDMKADFKQNFKNSYDKIYKVCSVLVAVSIIAVLLTTVASLPEFGNINNPTNNEVADRYIEDGLKETGAVNIVAGMILDYRAFDTLGESHVLFLAACSVLILLRMDYDEEGKLKSSGIKDEGYDRLYEPKNDTILQNFTYVLFPVIVMYGIYVILNGHISAGGGFSGGAIIGAALILYNNAFGFKKTKRFFTYNTFKWVSFVSLISYAGLKTYSFYCGANHIHSIIGLGTPGAILSSGLILPLNICVGCVVACTMYTFFVMFRKGGM
jgi:multicomponent Na+:H+ antiporter subunit B